MSTIDRVERKPMQVAKKAIVTQSIFWAAAIIVSALLGNHETLWLWMTVLGTCAIGALHTTSKANGP